MFMGERERGKDREEGREGEKEGGRKRIVKTAGE